MFRFACLILALAATCYGASIPDNRIVGGSNALSGQIPWQVSLRSTNGHFCSGSIINQRWILTAAHCLAGSASSTIVVTNTLFLNSGGDSYRVSRFVPHPNFNIWTITNDVGLIQTTSNIVYRSNTVQPARLPTSAFTAVNAAAIVSGWGTTSFPGNSSNQLLFLNTVVISQAQCRASSWRITDENICTFTRAGQGNCHGDSGGPLTSDGVLIGVVSFGNPCAVGDADAYARVFTYLSWIQEHTG